MSYATTAAEIPDAWFQCQSTDPRAAAAASAAANLDRLRARLRTA